jgi:hypothetical protein
MCKKRWFPSLKLSDKAIFLALLTVAFSEVGCQSNIYQSLATAVTFLPIVESTPTLVATAPPLNSPTIDPKRTDVVATATSKTPKKPTQVIPPTPTATSTSILVSPTPVRPIYYVSKEGNDQLGTGSRNKPWATIGFAVESVEDGAMIIVLPGTYYGQLSLNRTFSDGIVIQSEKDYQAQLRSDKIVISCDFCQGITISGFDIAHSEEGAARYVIQIQDQSEDQSGGRRVTLRNNIIHDSYNNDLIKVNRGADNVFIEGNMFYNMGGPGLDSHIDANSVTDVIIQDNVFFNDFAASGRDNNNDTGSFIVIKDSNGDEDTNLGSKSITVRRNIFLNWQGEENNTFLVIGEDNVSHFQADGVLVENNLMLGNAKNPMRAAFHVRGSRQITFRNNTVVGDLPSRSYAMRLSRSDENHANEGIYFYNNIWSDPTGTMGASSESNDTLFAQAEPADTTSVELLNNLYWNGVQRVPWDENQLVNYTDDPQRILANPGLSSLEDVKTPHWIAGEGRFADGSSTIKAVFHRLVMAYGATAASSPAIDAAAVQYAPEEDILGKPRSVPDIGAYEYPKPPQKD